VIINSFKAGQLGNRLFHISQLIVIAIETNSTLVDYSFDDYKENFEHLRDKPFIVYPPGKRNFVSEKLFILLKNRVEHLRDFIIHRKVSTRFFGYVSQHALKMDDYDSFLAERKNMLNYIVEGWINRDLTPLHEYRQQLAQFFLPASEHRQNVNSVIADARQNADLLVGIHIRRGDYKDYKNGEWYFDDTVYTGIMSEMQSIFPDKKMAFLICSNEPVAWGNYSAFNTIKATGQIIEDMYALSYCDYIIGPSSTYSMWASFIGEKPLMHITGKTMEFNFNLFKVINNRG
jgi:hypothetical protein